MWCGQHGKITHDTALKKALCAYGIIVHGERANLWGEPWRQLVNVDLRLEGGVYLLGAALPSARAARWSQH